MGAFAVACLDEGRALRRAGIGGRILILGYTPPEEAARLHRWRLTQTVADEAHGRALAAQGVPLEVHLALDTGMHRLGLPAEDREALARLYRLPNLSIRGVFSHLCVSDRLDEAAGGFTQKQLQRFYGAVRWLKEQGYDPGETHIQASYGIWNLPPQPCAWARAGIALYGAASDGGPTRRALDLHPVLSLRARVATVRTLAPGEGAGYGLAFRAGRPTRLAVVTAGYADGLPRALPQGGGGGAAGRAAVPHGGAHVHGPAAGGCDRCPAGCAGRGGYPHRPGRSGAHRCGGGGRTVRDHHQ